MAYISTLLDSPAVVSLVDGKLLAGGVGAGGGALYRAELFKAGLR